MNSANESRNSPPPKPRPLPSAGGSGGEYISINDSLPSSSPSGKTVLKVLASALGLIVLVVLYAKTIGF
jgi:hypothetical protein